ncbi:MAG: signal peptidase I [Treponema sp.]|jgi:signal peptidase I|nr:signal peptidase I [Treponema sp.]
MKIIEKKENDFFHSVRVQTEKFLSRRRALKRIRREKQKLKNPALDWVESFIWAACVVLLINQYLFQAYQIPSGSMIDTLLIRDRIFVNKLIFGPELLPGLWKLPSPIKPKRDDVIIFENPSYISRGPAFDIAQRIIYMLTLSLVDIDRDENGEPKAHFLIKRAAGMGGDRFKLEKGDFFIQFPGTESWTAETDYNHQTGRPHRLSRLMSQADYPALVAAGKAMGYSDMGLQPPQELLDTASAAQNLRYVDYFAYDHARLQVLRGLQPGNERYRITLARYDLGWYVPENHILPLGDNRDNSRDGRYFGSINKDKVLGQGAFIYWPLKRVGGIK